MFKNLQKMAKQAGNQPPPNVGAMGPIAAALLGGGALLWGGYNSIFTVEPGTAAVMYNRWGGVQDNVYGPGTHMMIPWLQTPTLFTTRARPHEIRSPTGTRDLQTVDITLRVLYKPSIDHLPKLLRETGTDYDARVLPSIVNETLKSVVAQYNANQLITRREEVSKLIRRNLTDRARNFDIMVDDVAITHLTFGKEYARAIEDKQVAQQEAERAKYAVLEAKQNKQAKIIKAQGEAESATMIGKAISQNPAYIELRRLDAATHIAELVANSPNKVYLDADSLLLNVNRSVTSALGEENVQTR